jgi:hypothetical protein
LRALTLPFPGGSVELSSALRSADRRPQGERDPKSSPQSPDHASPRSPWIHSRDVLFFFRCRIRSAGRYPKIPAQSIIQTIRDRYATKRPKGQVTHRPRRHAQECMTCHKPVLFPKKPIKSPNLATEAVRWRFSGSSVASPIVPRERRRRYRQPHRARYHHQGCCSSGV